MAGIPHNQLGKLDVGRCFGLNVVFHCLRAIVSPAPFKGARGNLASSLLNNETLIFNMKKNKVPMPSLQEQFAKRYSAMKLVHVRSNLGFVTQAEGLAHYHHKISLLSSSECSSLSEVRLILLSLVSFW